MSAPAALALAKLFYPETKKTKTGSEVHNIPSGQERNIIEAAAFGASQAIKLVANVAVNLVAFIALVAFLNQTLIWLGNRAGMEKPGNELIFQVKSSYEKLSVYIHNRENLTWYENLARIDNVTYTGRWRFDGDDIVYNDFNHTLTKGVLTERSVVISTYALCGFANIASIGIMLGALGAMAPNQRSALAQVVVRAMITGTVACFMTACIAGLLYAPGI
uniref:Solute carrier family 28 member 3-like n=1 Tax=Crassostrea virginica TaxID=6565 RepID=A0A8B8BZJ7_CRAVI|nr:solute carrier family 28 member 3-like [Crassostrea virginica]